MRLYRRFCTTSAEWCGRRPGLNFCLFLHRSGPARAGRTIPPEWDGAGRRKTKGARRDRGLRIRRAGLDGKGAPGAGRRRRMKAHGGTRRICKRRRMVASARIPAAEAGRAKKTAGGWARPAAGNRPPLTGDRRLGRTPRLRRIWPRADGADCRRGAAKTRGPDAPGLNRSDAVHGMAGAGTRNRGWPA